MTLSTEFDERGSHSRCSSLSTALSGRMWYVQRCLPPRPRSVVQKSFTSSKAWRFSVDVAAERVTTLYIVWKAAPKSADKCTLGEENDNIANASRGLYMWYLDLLGFLEMRACGKTKSSTSYAGITSASTSSITIISISSCEI